jgi:hypothetical protein
MRNESPSLGGTSVGGELNYERPGARPWVLAVSPLEIDPCQFSIRSRTSPL